MQPGTGAGQWGGLMLRAAALHFQYINQSERISWTECCFQDTRGITASIQSLTDNLFIATIICAVLNNLGLGFYFALILIHSFCRWAAVQGTVCFPLSAPSGKSVIFLMYFNVKECTFSIITPVFSVTRSFRNHSYMLIYCSRNFLGVCVWKP